MIRLLGKLLRDRHGATALEYSLFVALVALAIVSAVSAVGVATRSTWNNASGSISAVAQ